MGSAKGSTMSSFQSFSIFFLPISDSAVTSSNSTSFFAAYVRVLVSRAAQPRCGEVWRWPLPEGCCSEFGLHPDGGREGARWRKCSGGARRMR